MYVILLNLAASVALLLWSIRMIRTGVERASLPRLRHALTKISHNSLYAAAGGTFGALAMQSSTAVALIACGFAASGMLTTASSLAMVLGADLGSALAVWVFLLPVHAAIPVFILIGVAIFLKAKRGNLKQLGRVLIGFAFVLMAITMIRESIAPLQANATIGNISGYLVNDLFAVFLFAAAIAWLMHSSLAAVITIASFAASDILIPPVALAMVIGANLGGAMIAVGLLWTSHRSARVVVIGNLIARGVITLLAITLLNFVSVPNLSAVDLAQVCVLLHIGLNATLLITLPITKHIISLSERFVPRENNSDQQTLVSFLDDKSLNRPNLALACAQRELVVMFENTHVILSNVLKLFRDFDPDLVRQIEKHESSINKSHYELKLFLAKLRRQGLTESQNKKTLEMISVANCLEEAADHVSSNLVMLSSKMAKSRRKFSDEGMRDLEQFHDQIMANAQLSLAVMTTGDIEMARLVLREKDRVRAEELRLQERHLERLQAGSPQSKETSNSHQEILRIIKHINAAISYVAYPIVNESGDLLNSRLAVTETRSSSVST